MAPSFRLLNQTSTASGTSVTSNITGVQDGDIMLAILQHSQAAATVTVPAGWSTAVGNVNGADFSIRVLYRVKQAGDANQAFNFSTTGLILCDLYAASGVDTSAPIAGTPGSLWNNAASVSVATTPGVADCLLVGGAGVDSTGGARTWTISSGGLETWTERVDAANGAQMRVVGDAPALASTMRNVTFTPTGSTQDLIGWVVAIKPAPSGTNTPMTVTATVTASTTRTSKTRQPNTVTSTVTSAIARKSARARSATATVAAAVAKKTRRARSVTSAITAAFSKQRVKQIALSVTTAVTSSVRRRMLLVRPASPSVTAAVRRLTRRSRSVTAGATATVRRALHRSLGAASVTVSAQVRRLSRKARSATVSASATVRRLTRRARQSAVSITSAFSKAFQSGAGTTFTKAYSVTVTGATTIRRKAGKALGVTPTVAASVRRAVRVSRVAGVTASAQVARRMARALAAAVSVAAQVGKGTRRLLSTAVSVVLSFIKVQPSAAPAPEVRTYRAPGFSRSTRPEADRAARASRHDRRLYVEDTDRVLD